MWWPSSGQLQRTGWQDYRIDWNKSSTKVIFPKAMDQVAKMKRMEEKRIPANIDWDDIDSIATEARQKFKLINPETIGQASRISGVNPAIFLFWWCILKVKIVVFLKIKKKKHREKQLRRRAVFFDLYSMKIKSIILHLVWGSSGWWSVHVLYFIKEWSDGVDNSQYWQIAR